MRKSLLVTLLCGFLCFGYCETYAAGKMIAYDRYHHIIKKYHRDPRLVKAIIKVESNWRPRVISSEGAIGLMQVMPKTAKTYGVKRHELFNPEINIRVGCAILKDYQKKSKSLKQALTKYVGGDGNYYRKVMSAYAKSV